MGQTQTAQTMTDCGHTEAGPYAHWRLEDGTERRLCKDCAYTIAMADMREQGDTFGYWAPERAETTLRAYGSPFFHDLGTITTWPGLPMLRVTRAIRQRVGFGYFPERWYYQAVDTGTGERWHGNGAGPGMYARMYRSRATAQSKTGRVS